MWKTTISCTKRTFFSPFFQREKRKNINIITKVSKIAAPSEPQQLVNLPLSQNGRGKTSSFVRFTHCRIKKLLPCYDWLFVLPATGVLVPRVPEYVSFSDEVSWHFFVILILVVFFVLNAVPNCSVHSSFSVPAVDRKEYMIRWMYSRCVEGTGMSLRREKTSTILFQID